MYLGVFIKQKTETRVSIKMNHSYFAEVATLAQKAGVRGKGVLLYNKKHGFDVPNTKSLAKFFRWLVRYYEQTEPERLERQAGLLAKKQALEEEMKKQGML